MKNNPLSLSRSYNFGPAKYFSETLMPMVNVDEIKEDYGTKQAAFWIRAFMTHEMLHSKTTVLGDNMFRLRNTNLEFESLFNTKEKPDLTKILTIEILNQTLYEQTTNLQESLAAYVVDMTESLHESRETLQKFMNQQGIPGAEHDDRLSVAQTLLSLSKKIKKKILENDEVQKIYDNLNWIRENFDDKLPEQICRLSLDIPLQFDGSKILDADTYLNPVGRFYLLLDYLEYLVENNKNNEIPYDEKEHYFLGSEEKQFGILAEKFQKLLRMRFGFLEIKEFGIEKFVLDLFAKSNIKKETNELSKFAKFDLHNYKDRKLGVPLASTTQHLWYGIVIDNTLHLFANTQNASDYYLEKWLDWFYRWYLKECIIRGQNVDDYLSFFVGSKVIPESYVKKAKLHQATLEIEKSDIYDTFQKLVKK